MSEINTALDGVIPYQVLKQCDEATLIRLARHLEQVSIPSAVSDRARKIAEQTLVDVKKAILTFGEEKTPAENVELNTVAGIVTITAQQFERTIELIRKGGPVSAGMKLEEEGLSSHLANAVVVELGGYIRKDSSDGI